MFGSRSRGHDDVLLVGLGNPGAKYAATRHNIGFEVVNRVAERAGFSRAKRKYSGLFSEGKIDGVRTAALLPQTFMNEAGKSVSPARGALKLPLDRVVVVHDEIDLPFGKIETRLGGGLAGHNGLKSIASELGSKDFWRIRVGVGRPDSTDPKIVSAYVLGRFSESKAEVAALVAEVADSTCALLEELVLATD